jgi:hypothetical protein
MQAGLGLGVSALLGRRQNADAQVGTTYNVGPTRTYKSLFDLYNSVTIQSGDTILIDGGTTYVNDLFEPPFGRTNITLRWSGVGATRPILQGGNRVMNNNDKGLLWVTGGGWVIEDLEITNVVSSGGNGAPISFESANGATVRRCLFRNNQLGMRIIGNCTGSAWLFEHNEFRNNGIGDGFTHNFYCQSDQVTELVFQYNYSHDCDEGHLFKSRARVNKVLYNRFEEGPTVDCNACLNFPYGGTAFVIGNIIQKKLNSGSPWHMTWWDEQFDNGGAREVYLINNTWRHEGTGAGFFAMYVRNQATVFESRNNVFWKSGTAWTIYDTRNISGFGNGRTPSLESTNVSTATDPGFSDPVNLDFHLLPTATSLVNQGSAPQIRQGFNTTPTKQYVHLATFETRPDSGAVDIGAYELLSGDVTPPAPPSALRAS